MRNQTDFSSRIGVRAVTAGVVISFTTMILLMSLIAALGLWDFYLDEMAHASPSFWIAMTIAWGISMFVAGAVAALAARAQTVLEGVLNALAASCGSYLLFGMASLFFAPRVVVSLLNMASPQLFLRGFIADLLGFAVAIYGGIVAVHFEQHSFEAFRKGRKYFATNG